MELIEASREDATRRGEGRAVTLAEYTTALLYNGLGGYQRALAAAQRACEYDALGPFAWSLIELVEAAARSREPELAGDALEQLSERTQMSGTDWALGVEARSRALLSNGRTAEGLYLEATERLRRCRIKVHLARTYLLYGEWLRREHRRIDARETLRTAHEMFSTMGAEAFAERAEHELLATGERARKRTTATRDQLTAQEAQIAELARDGHSNPEIGAQLFIGRRTVEYHLDKVFTKLEISSRSELQRVLGSEARQTQPIERTHTRVARLGSSLEGPGSPLGRYSMRTPALIAHARRTTSARGVRALNRRNDMNDSHDHATAGSAARRVLAERGNAPHGVALTSVLPALETRRDLPRSVAHVHRPAGAVGTASVPTLGQV